MTMSQSGVRTGGGGWGGALSKPSYGQRLAAVVGLNARGPSVAGGMQALAGRIGL